MSSAPPARSHRLGQAPEAAIDRLDRLDRRAEIAGMADHVGVGEIDDDRRRSVPLSIASTSLSVTSGADISGLQIVGRDLGRGHQDAALAGKLLLAPAIEEEGDVRVFLGLGDAQLRQAGLRHQFAESVARAPRAETASRGSG